MAISTRAAKCLKRIAANKSIPDIGALGELRRSGFITMTYPPEEITITVTPIGKAFLRGNRDERA